MVKQAQTIRRIQTIRRQDPTNCFSVFGHIVGLALNGLVTCSTHFVLIF